MSDDKMAIERTVEDLVEASVKEVLEAEAKALGVELSPFTVVLVAIYHDPENPEDEMGLMQACTLHVMGVSADHAEKMTQVAFADVLTKAGADWDTLYVAATFAGHHKCLDTASMEPREAPADDRLLPGEDEPEPTFSLFSPPDEDAA